MTGLVLFILLQSTNVEVIYRNMVYKINCSQSLAESGNMVYTIYGQDYRFDFLTNTINVYAGTDVLGFMDEVTEFVEAGQKDDVKLIQGYRVTIGYKGMKFNISEKRGNGWKMVPTKTWIKMRKKLADVIN